MAIPSTCPKCGRDLRITRTGMGGPDDVTTANCPGCEYRETFAQGPLQ